MSDTEDTGAPALDPLEDSDDEGKDEEDAGWDKAISYPHLIPADFVAPKGADQFKNTTTLRTPELYMSSTLSIPPTSPTATGSVDGRSFSYADQTESVATGRTTQSSVNTVIARELLLARQQYSDPAVYKHGTLPPMTKNAPVGSERFVSSKLGEELERDNRPAWDDTSRNVTPQLLWRRGEPLS